MKKYSAFAYSKQIAWACAALILGSCTQPKQTETQQTFKIIQPFVSDTSYNQEYIVDIQSVQNVKLRNRISGFIERVLVDEGRPVRQGQTLFVISSKKYKQELQKAEALTQSARAKLKTVEIELDNIQKLFDKNIVSKAELDLAHAKLDIEKAALTEALANEAHAQLNLSYTQIQAPFDGVINRIPNKIGSFVEEGTELTSISNTQEMYAYFHVSEKEYIDYAMNQNSKETNKVSLKLANGELYNQDGRIETVESEFDPSTGNIAFRAKFPNSEGILKHGATGKIVEKKHIKKALMIPQKSTFEIQDKLYVFIVNEAGIIEQKNIVSSMRLPHIYIVESGLNPQDKIIWEGVQYAKNGEKIHVEKVKNWISINK